MVTLGALIRGSDQGNGEAGGRLGSLLHDLVLVAHVLAERYCWRPLEAVEFLIQGRAPKVCPISFSPYQLDMGTFKRAGIMLSMHGSVSVSTVTRVFRRTQRYLLGGDNRSLGPILIIVGADSRWEIRSCRMA